MKEVIFTGKSLHLNFRTPLQEILDTFENENENNVLLIQKEIENPKATLNPRTLVYPNPKTLHEPYPNPKTLL